MRSLTILLIIVLSLISARPTEDDAKDGAFPPAGQARIPASDADFAALVDGNTAFAFDLYHQLAADNDDNLIFSPYSISLAFAMLYAGAGGETEAQMAETLHFDLKPEQLHAAFRSLDPILQPPAPPAPTPTPSSDDRFAYSPAENLTVSIANGIWGQEGFPFENAYLDVLVQDYGADMRTVDFSGNPDAAHQIISQWVEEATWGRINDTPPREAITPETRLALTNAIYFKGEWTYPFTGSGSGVFHTIDNRGVSVTMMGNNSAWMECARGEDYYAIQLRYGASESASMLVLIPDTGRFHEVETALDAALFQDVRGAVESTNMLTFRMPRFQFESEHDLRSTLSAMGMPSVFGNDADFSGISPNPLFVGYAGHKATISVDEQGTEATGTTSVFLPIMAAYAECENMVAADRPFIFAIVQNPGTVLFLGRVMDPSG